MNGKLSINILILMALLVTFQASAQTLTQTVRGKVTDHITKSPIPGANVMVLGSDPLIGAVTDGSGDFRITQVPVGTHTLRIGFIGYKDVILAQVQVNSGKETVLTIVLEEEINQMNEVVVSATEKERTINDMVTVSGRTFSVEETRKYAAAINDPGRMATSFAGVVGADDGNNNISIRGNNPNALLWRMEGIDIPNPNHFAASGAAGGGVAILSAQLLDNSDFITGAFPAEYGNALSGVFDLNLRKGNNEKREFTVQASLLGTDIAVEGPFSKNYRGSYLINYRYSTLSMLAGLGVPLGDFVTNFQDLSFNFFLPTGKKSTVTVFGFGGLSDQNRNALLDSLSWQTEFDRMNSNFFSNTGAVGIKHAYILNKSNFLQTTVLASGSNMGDKYGLLNRDYMNEERFYSEFGQSKITFSSVLNTKISPKYSLRSGVFLNQLYYNVLEQGYGGNAGQMQTHIDAKGSTQSVQAFSQLNVRASQRLTLNFGVHYLQLILNNSTAVEPRFSASYALDEKQRINLGYGLHSQVQPLGTYFAQVEEDGVITFPNKDLKLSRSHHLVLGYDRSLNPYLRMKIETYYQHLYDIPVIPGVNQTTSILNQEWSLMTDHLVNTGFGKNYGAEFTLEHFTYRDFYFLLSTSFYRSQYKTEENLWRNTRFNGRYNLAFTAGKEYHWKKNRSFGINLRTIYGGGLWNTPIDLEASIVQGGTVLVESLAFTEQNPAYFRTDVRVSLKRNRPKSTRTVALDVQNATNRKNVFGRYFEPMDGSINTVYLVPLIPVLSYRVEF
ncbi:TonB-dependent receptor [Indibacter alkaliphilus LW1]|uniref:TonB-dependent receptor n=1 Tax=Indibacter alkaliphilus (strain CCUG 57479 / KCTC 22604 / LW1) TaxID=1189612 RepID=S2DFF0_INDAL|nr:TonB-dependent receptor [Indibacter alkaliphilus]EOZ97842.1 TonB-dependent receptor [Indibacter alkaliphilus LW1]